jgi:hypothetical protein
MQIFEVTAIPEYPYMGTKEIVEGNICKDIISDSNSEKAFLLIDHDTKRIWTYNGPHCPITLQIYNSILAGLLRQQLRLFYRIFSLNQYPGDSKEFQEILDKQIGGGKARSVEKNDFPDPAKDKQVSHVSLHNPKLNQALEYINQFPLPQNFKRRFLIIGGTIYTEEEIPEIFEKKEETTKRTQKLGRLNAGFTFFDDHKYSTRLIIKDRNIQGIELFIDKEDKAPSLKLEIPLIPEDKFTKPGNIDKLLNAFQIPKKPPKEEENITQNDSINKS